MTDTASPQPIFGFFEEYRFLSNFEGPGFWAFGLHWPTNEHFYQAMKSRHLTDWETVARAITPNQAKRLGRALDVQPGWDSYLKESFMRLGLWYKFQDPTARTKLLATGDAYLEETNTWGDRYWGTDPDHVGQNRLGFLLMELRHILRNPDATLASTSFPF